MANIMRTCMFVCVQPRSRLDYASTQSGLLCCYLPSKNIISRHATFKVSRLKLVSVAEHVRVVNSGDGLC